MIKSKKRLYDDGVIVDDGEPNENMILEVAIDTFSGIVSVIHRGFISAEEFKELFKYCEAQNDWTLFYNFIKAFLIANKLYGNIECDIFEDCLASTSYCYFFAEMLDMLDELLANLKTCDQDNGGLYDI